MITNICDRIDIVYDKRFILQRKKKNLINVKDGIVAYTVNATQLNCQCMTDDKSICNHLLFVLFEQYKLSIFVITFIMINEVKDKFKKYLDSGIKLDNLDLKLSNDITKILNKTECGICLAPLSNSKKHMDLYECEMCHNMVHLTCMKKWESFKTTDGSKKGCIYCMTKTFNSLGF